jgi:hypothetical protein
MGLISSLSRPAWQSVIIAVPMTPIAEADRRKQKRGSGFGMHYYL